MSNHYDVITVGAGERHVERLGSGETFENVIFDITASGAGAIISATGTNWTIRNVGWRGQFGNQGRALGIADTGGGTSTVENIYIADGVEGGVGDTRHPQLGLWVDPDHNGHLDIRYCNICFAHDNSFYGSAPGYYNSNGGSIHFYRCYAQDSWVSGFRLARGTVEECVAANTSSGRNGRPLWIWPTDQHGERVEVLNCHFTDGSYPLAIDIGREGRRTDVYIEGCQIQGDVQTHRGNVNVEYGPGNGSDAQIFIPEGVPTSPEMAASGEGGGEAPPTDPSVPDDEPDPEPSQEPPSNVPLKADAAAKLSSLENVHVAVPDGIGLRAREGNVLVRDSEIAGDDPRTTEDGGSIHSVNTNWGDAADPEPPEYVPMRPSEAYAGDSDGSDPQ